MRWVRVHAQNFDLAVHGPHPRSDLVERRDHVLLGVAVHGACKRHARDLLDGDVDKRGAVVEARHAQFKHVEDIHLAEVGQGLV